MTTRGAIQLSSHKSLSHVDTLDGRPMAAPTGPQAPYNDYYQLVRILFIMRVTNHPRLVYLSAVAVAVRKTDNNCT